MTSIIVSSRSDFRSFKEPTEDLMIVYQYTTPIYTTSSPSNLENYDVYLPVLMDLPDETKDYINHSGLKINVDEFAMPYEALDQIYEKIIASEKDDNEQHSLVIASDFNFSKLAEAYFNRKNKEFGTDIGILNLIKHMKFIEFNSLVNSIKSLLGVNDIYPNDLIAFSYAVRQIFP